MSVAHRLNDDGFDALMEAVQLHASLPLGAHARSQGHPPHGVGGVLRRRRPQGKRGPSAIFAENDPALLCDELCEAFETDEENLVAKWGVDWELFSVKIYRWSWLHAIAIRMAADRSRELRETQARNAQDED